MPYVRLLPTWTKPTYLFKTQTPTCFTEGNMGEIIVIKCGKRLNCSAHLHSSIYIFTIINNSWGIKRVINLFIYLRLWCVGKHVYKKSLVIFCNQNIRNSTHFTDMEFKKSTEVSNHTFSALHLQLCIVCFPAVTTHCGCIFTAR